MRVGRRGGGKGRRAANRSVLVEEQNPRCWVSLTSAREGACVEFASSKLCGLVMPRRRTRACRWRWGRLCARSTRTDEPARMRGHKRPPAYLLLRGYHVTYTRTSHRIRQARWGNEGMENGGGGRRVGLVHSKGLWARRPHTSRPGASTLLLVRRSS